MDGWVGENVKEKREATEEEEKWGGQREREGERDGRQRRAGQNKIGMVVSNGVTLGGPEEEKREDRSSYA